MTDPDPHGCELSGDGWAVFRDPHGVPHVQARDLEALAFGHGAVTARDRVWQLEVLRTRAESRSGHLLGPEHDDGDHLSAALGIEETARSWWEAAGSQDRVFLAGYARGVSSQLSQAWAASPEVQSLGLGHRPPRPWQPWTPIAVHLDVHLLAGSLPEQLWRHRVRRQLGAQWLDALDAESPRTAGSNAWLVPGRLSASGAPMIAADPHRIVEESGPYQPVCLSCPGVRVRGLALVGLPGVPHFGRTESAAWAITASMAVTEQLAEITVVRCGGQLVQQETGEPLIESGFRDSTGALRVIRRCRQGRVLPGSSEREAALSDLPEGGTASVLVVRTAAEQLSPSSAATALSACRTLLGAGTAADVLAAAQSWAVPVNDLVAADTTGRCVHAVIGATARPLPEPRDVDDLLVRANQRPPDPIAAGSVLGCAPPHRARRAEHLLRQAHRDSGAISAEDLLSAQLDTRSSSLLGLVHALLAPADAQKDSDDDAGGTVDPAAGPCADRTAGSSSPVAGSEVEALRQELLEWDGEMAADSVVAARAAQWRDLLARHLAGHPALEPLRGATGLPPLWDPLLGTTPRVGLALESIVTLGPGLGLDPGPCAQAALEELAAQLDRPSGSPWGVQHAFAPWRACDQLLPFAPVPVGGDSDALLAAGVLPGLGAGCARVPSARVLWDLAHPAASAWITPDPVDRGQLGSRPLDRWAAGEIDQALPWVPPGAPASTDRPHPLGGLHLRRPAAQVTSEAPVGASAEESAGAPGFGADAPLLSLRPVDPLADAELLHGWVSSPRAVFWGMGGLEAETVSAIYAEIAASDSHHAWVLELEDRPLGLLQTYQPHADPIGGAYLPRAGDLGMHLLLAPARRPQPGLTSALAESLAQFLFADPATRRVVAEPDASNWRAVRRMQRTGFELGPQIRLPDKIAQLAFLTRETLQGARARGDAAADPNQRT